MYMKISPPQKILATPLMSSKTYQELEEPLIKIYGRIVQKLQIGFTTAQLLCIERKKNYKL